MLNNFAATQYDDELFPFIYDDVFPIYLYESTDSTIAIFAISQLRFSRNLAIDELVIIVTLRIRLSYPTTLVIFILSNFIFFICWLAHIDVLYALAYYILLVGLCLVLVCSFAIASLAYH